MMERDKPPSCGAEIIDDRTAVPPSPGWVARNARVIVGVKGVAGQIHLSRREGGEFG